MNLQEMRDHFRTYLDVEEEEAPNDLIDVWFRDGYNRAIAIERHWPFFEVTHDFTTSAGTRTYALTTIAADGLREVVSVVDNTRSRPLESIDEVDARRIYVGVLDAEAEPYFFSFSRDSVHLYPKPSGEHELTLIGYRAPADWIAEGAGGEPDCPEQMHVPIISWALARYYAKEEDPEMASLHRDMFESGIQTAHRDIMQANRAHPLVVSKGVTGPSYDRWLTHHAYFLGS